jgi:hypothetical protein
MPGSVDTAAGEQFLDVPEIAPSCDSKSWHLLGYSTPKSQIIFFAQIIIIYLVIGVSLINLSIDNGDSNLWAALLCSSFGLLLPAPSIKPPKNNVLSSPA